LSFILANQLFIPKVVYNSKYVEYFADLEFCMHAYPKFATLTNLIF